MWNRENGLHTMKFQQNMEFVIGTRLFCLFKSNFNQLGVIKIDQHIGCLAVRAPHISLELSNCRLIIKIILNIFQLKQQLLILVPLYPAWVFNQLNRVFF
jgi:hypothetical protein